VFFVQMYQVNSFSFFVLGLKGFLDTGPEADPRFHFCVPEVSFQFLR
jgi:hypothetical protein